MLTAQRTIKIFANTGQICKLNWTLVLVLKTDFHLNFTYKISSYHKQNIFHIHKIIKSIHMMVLYEQLAFILGIAQNTQTICAKFSINIMVGGTYNYHWALTT